MCTGRAFFTFDAKNVVRRFHVFCRLPFQKNFCLFDECKVLIMSFVAHNIKFRFIHLKKSKLDDSYGLPPWYEVLIQNIWCIRCNAYEDRCTL